MLASACASPYEEARNEIAPPAALDSGTTNEGGPNCAGDAASCNPCGEGLQDRDGDGACLPACAPTTCPAAHELCDDASGTATCACAIGYTRTVDGCTFSGGPLDPGFSGAGGTPAWTTSANASIDTSASVLGGVDVGVAVFHGTAVVTQSFDMPPFAQAEPLAMEINGGCQSECTNLANATMAFALGDRALDIAWGFNGLTPRRVCLGDRAFGRNVTLRVASFQAATLGAADEDGILDRLAFVPAADCPRPSEVMNANFEADGGWTTGGQGVAEVVNGLGTGGSRAGHLNGVMCQRPTLSTTISVPESLPNAALTFSWKGTQNREAFVSLDGKRIAMLHGTGTFDKAVVCLPEWTRGFANTLNVTAGEWFGACATFGENDVTVDDFAVGSDPACAAAPASILDGDFERRAQIGWPEGLGDGVQVAVVRDDPQAHGGSSRLALTAKACARVALADQWMSVPSRPGAGAATNGGPAVSFWYRTPNAPQGSAFAISGKSLSTSSDWKQDKVCLPPALWGRVFDLTFASIAPSTGMCTDTTLNVDDVTSTIDPSCPAD